MYRYGAYVAPCRTLAIMSKKSLFWSGERTYTFYRITKNYRGITFTSLSTKIYNALLLNHIEPEIKKILRKNQNGFRRNQFTASQILTIHQIIRVCAKNLEVTFLFVDSSKAFDSIHRGKVEQILLAYGLSKETVTAIMMLYKNMKIRVHSYMYLVH